MKPTSAKRGITTALVLQALMVMTVLGLALGTVGAQCLHQVRASEDREVLLHIANGGIHEVMDNLYNTPDYGTASNPKPGVVEGGYATGLPDATYWYSFDATSGQPYSTNNLNGSSPTTGFAGLTVPAYSSLVIASAAKAGRAGSWPPLRVAAVVARIFPYGVAADGTIQVAAVSTVGPDPSVRSNLSGGNPNISAMSINGNSYSRDGIGSISISGSPVGRENFRQDPFPLPDIPVAAMVNSFNPTASTHPYGGPASYAFTGSQTASSDSDGTLHIGGVTIPPPPHGYGWSIFVNGDLTFNGGLTLPLRVNLYVNGQFLVNGGGGLNQIDTNGAMTANPSPIPTAYNDSNIFANSVRLNGGTTQALNLFSATTILQNGSSSYHGLMYTEQGTISMNGNQSVTGVMIARGGSVSAGNANVTYEPTVLQVLNRYGLGLNTPTRVKVLSWWRLP